MTRALALLVSSLLLAAPSRDGGFRDITQAAGVTFQHHAAPEKKYIVESMSGGVALFDYDNDGRLDIYFVDSLTVETAGDPTKARSALYRNVGNLKFEDVTDKAGVAHPGWGMGACTADVDGDGWEDLYVTAVGGNKFYRNNHDGTFSDVTARAGARRQRLVRGVRIRRFRSRWRPRPLRQPLRESRPAAAATVRTRQDVSVPRHSGAVRPARIARRVRLSLQKRWRPPIHGDCRTGGRRRSSRPRSASAWPGSTTTRTAGRICSSPTIQARTSCIRTRRTARSRKSRFRWASP